MSLNILAVETATDSCSAALLCRDQITERFQLAARSHTALILPMLQSLLAEAGVGLAQLDALAFSRGPGSFTGVRVAASVVQASAVAFDIPVVPISSLRVLAQGIYRVHHYRQILTAFDARRGEVYWSAYQLQESGVLSEYTPERLDLPEQVDFFQALLPLDWVGAGSGWDVYHEILQNRLPVVRWLAQCYPRAYDVVSLAKQDYQQANYVDAAQALPIYLRNEYG